ncbi:hypothetical protein BS78_08G097400 [Paspalum vaginatum]|nr:hypothetical protein BS78_08G097400 [Paspalum vaginatum]
MNSLASTVTTLDNLVATIQADQSRLTVAVNKLQSQVMEDQHGKNKDDNSSSNGSGGSFPPPPPQLMTHKLRFPKYNSVDNPVGWLHKCEQFFRSQGTPTDQQVWMASYMEGAAQQCMHNLFGELAALRRTGTVVAYQDQFLKLLARCENVTEKKQVDLFSAGLRNPMKTDVEMQALTTLEDAMALA